MAKEKREEETEKELKEKKCASFKLAASEDSCKREVRESETNSRIKRRGERERE